MKGKPLGDTVVLTLRLSARDRVLLDRLVNLEARELAERGVDVSVASVLRQLIRSAAKERGVDIAANEPVPKLRRRSVREPSVSPERVRRLLVKLAEQQRGLAAEIARRFDVEPAQVSKFKNGHEGFPVGKLDALHEFLSAQRRGA